MFKKAVIIGTGLIGGSIGFEMRKRRLAGEIVGMSRHKKNALLAKKKSSIDRLALGLDEVKDADLIILATPVEAIIETGKKIASLVNKNCLVIDVGSTKEKIVTELSALIPGFIGCHPLAGSEKKGALNLEEGLFHGSVCVITPAPKTPKNLLNKAKSLWKKLGSRVAILSPGEHDRILSLTSHLPHALAFSLIAAVPEKFLSFSSGGLKDSTRIAASDPDLWSEIFLSNRDNLLAAFSSFQNKFNALKLALAKRNKKSLVKILKTAGKKREILK